jgi:hypothetical protein
MKVSVKEAANVFYSTTDFPSNSSLDAKKQSEHFVAGDWNELLEQLPTSITSNFKSVIVYEDFSALIAWADLLGKNNVAFWHPDKDFTEIVDKHGLKCYNGDMNMIPKNLHGVGNPAFSVTIEVLEEHPPTKSLCMVMPSTIMVAPNFSAGGPWGKTQKVKKKIEDMGLKEVYHIPNGFFTQMGSNGKLKNAQVDSVLVLTEPGYTGEVKVTNMLSGEVFYMDRGAPYVKTASILSSIELFGKGNELKFPEAQVADFIADKWALGVNIYNPFAKSSGANGNHLEGLKLYKPGDTIKKNTVYCYFDDEITAKTMLTKLSSKKIATAYQNITTQKSFSGPILRMLKV